MKTISVPADALADLEHALALQATGQRDAAFEKRLAEQTEQIRREIRSSLWDGGGPQNQSMQRNG